LLSARNRGGYGVGRRSDLTKNKKRQIMDTENYRNVYPPRRGGSSDQTPTSAQPRRGQPVEQASVDDDLTRRGKPATEPAAPPRRLHSDNDDLPPWRDRPVQQPSEAETVEYPERRKPTAPPRRSEPEPDDLPPRRLGSAASHSPAETEDLAQTGHSIARSAKRAIGPKLSGLWEQVFRVLRQYGPQTANQVVNRLPPTNLSNNNVRSRLKELVGFGRVVITGVVKDPVSGYRARQYRVLGPGEMPPPPESRPRRASRAQLEAKITRLEVENEALKSKLSNTGRNSDPCR
jgi:hypothetical protein